MPHITVKLYEGKDEKTKQRLAKALSEALFNITGNKEPSVSVEIIDVAPQNWKAEVYDSKIAPKLSRLHKEPGYKM